ncbi:MAG: NUDIX hydrolase [Candidatus Rokubacteria bacterium]|nr:NUDIX hydrolase [Candidatus Rokubacteria bacterium]
MKWNDSGGDIVAHYVVPVKPTPVTPAPAATLVLLRDRSAGPFDVLLIRRHDDSKFAAGAFVFPGGKIEPDDNPGDAPAWCRGPAPLEAARILGLEDAPRVALGYWIGSIRETFEEAGVLLAYGPDGRPAGVADPRFAAYRRACHADNRAFWDMIRAERFTLATDRLVYFAHWITPEVNPLRFDTRFFAAEMPAAQEAAADEREITEIRWLPVREAFEANARGELPLRAPTMKNLALFDGAPTAAEALARLRGRRVQTIRPRVIGEGATRTVLMPGDPGYF